MRQLSKCCGGGALLPPRLSAAALLACTLLVLGAGPLATRALAQTAGDNSWQIVSGRYDSSHATSEGLDSSQLSEHNFIESSDGAVRVTKTVEATGTEDEFWVHLSVDTCAKAVQVTDYKSFFESMPWEGVTSNAYHGETPGTVKDSISGSGVTVAGGAHYANRATFEIQDPQGRTIAKDVTVSWSQANNVTFFVKMGGRYILMGLKVGVGASKVVRLSDEAYKLVQDSIKGAVKQGPNPTLGSVTDVMGADVEYMGDVSAQSGAASYDDASNTLTWSPQYKQDYRHVTEDPVVHEERNEHGAVTKVTVTTSTWNYGVASLVYKVRLNTQTPRFKSSYDPADVTNPYDTNDRASLSYSYSDDGSATNDKQGSVDFPKPEVKGVLYDLALKKVDEDGRPLPGATFSLVRSWTDSNGGPHEETVSESLVSDGEGNVTVTGLPWGSYTLQETVPPKDFVFVAANVYSRDYSLSYTVGQGAGLWASDLTSPGLHHAMSSADVPTMMNYYYKQDVRLLKVSAADSAKTLPGARFTIWRDDGDGAFDPDRDASLGELETDGDGLITFKCLRVGTYFVEETYAPSGYGLSDNVYRIRVFSDADEAGGTPGNHIQVGLAGGGDMRAPEHENQLTVADKPIPSLPVTAGPGTGGMFATGACLIASGLLALLACRLHDARRSRMRR